MDNNIRLLINQLNGLDKSDILEDGDRKRLIMAAQALIPRLERSTDFTHRIAFEEPAFTLALQVAKDVGIYAILGAKGSHARVAELASMTGADADLLRRVLRHLAINGVIYQDDEDNDVYHATEISESLATPGGAGSISFRTQLLPAFCKTAEMIREHGYRAPNDSRKAAFQGLHGLDGLTFFECLQQPKHQQFGYDFDMMMQFNNLGRRMWLDVVDTAALLVQRPCISEYLLVDVGGGVGRDAIAFRKRFQEIPGKVEIQDLASVIENSARPLADLPDGGNQHGILLQPHNFFDAQPVQGARFYLLGSICHDWPEPDAARILANIAAAMVKGYSTLFLKENVVQNKPSHPYLSGIDLNMLVLFGARERTEEDWQRLLSSVGLQLIKVHNHSASLKSVLECELAD